MYAFIDSAKYTNMLFLTPRTNMYSYICAAYSPNTEVRVNRNTGWLQTPNFVLGRVLKVEVEGGIYSAYTIKYEHGEVERGVQHLNIIGIFFCSCIVYVSACFFNL